MAQLGGAIVDELEVGADWFGEHAPFDSIAQLAAALPSLEVVTPGLVPSTATTGAAAPPAGADPEDGELEDELGQLFEIIRARETDVSAPAAVIAESSAAPPPTWSVRIAGVDPLPLREPGRSGWSMRNSVQILRRAEDLVLRLRQEAVITAFDAAARALRAEP